MIPENLFPDDMPALKRNEYADVVRTAMAMRDPGMDKMMRKVLTAYMSREPWASEWRVIRALEMVCKHYAS